MSVRVQDQVSYGLIIELHVGIGKQIIIDHWRSETDRLSIIIDYVNYVTCAWNLIKR